MKEKSPSIHRTPLYRAKAAYSNMLRRCKGGNAVEKAYSKVEVRMSLEEWLEWAIPRYKKFSKDNPYLTPNVSRKKDRGHYEIGNIRIVSSSVNQADRKGKGKKYKFECPMCGNFFEKRAHKGIDRGLKRGRKYCCSRSCGSAYGALKKS